MATFLCIYTNGPEKHYEADSAAEAYAKYLDEVGVRDEDVFVQSGLLGKTQKFTDHRDPEVLAIATSGQDDSKNIVSAMVAEKARATKNAHNSLSSTDVLLQQLIAKQDETNQWLRKIRWSIWCILLILVIWNLFGWRIIPIR